MLKPVLFSALLLLSGALNCDPISLVPDINCDGSLVITAVGDSLVYGWGDSENKNHGGYVKRLQKMLKSATVNNLGDKGMFTRELVKLVTDAFQQPESSVAQIFKTSDYVIIDVGRNDRWFFGPPLKAYRNLKRAADMIRSRVRQETGKAPYVVIANLMLPNRGAQGPWVKELNTYILAGNSASNPSDLRFDLVSKRLLGADRIHPTPAGYLILAKVLYRYLTVSVPSKLSKTG